MFTNSQISKHSSSFNYKLENSREVADDSDDENIKKLPVLSGYGSALFSRSSESNSKGNWTPDMEFNNAKGTRDENRNNITDTITNYLTLNNKSEEQFTPTTQLHKNSQNSATTVFQDTLHLPDNEHTPTIREGNTNMLNNMKQAMTTDAKIRPSSRITRKFLHRSRIGNLGPATRTSSILADTFPFSPQPNISNSNIYPTHDTMESDIKLESRLSAAQEASPKQPIHQIEENYPLSNNHTKVVPKPKTVPNSIDYSSIDFEGLNPLTYSKKYSIPSSEISKLANAYYNQQQKEEQKAELTRRSNSRLRLTNKLTQSNSNPNTTNNTRGSLMNDNRNTMGYDSSDSLHFKQNRKYSNDRYSSNSALKKNLSSPIVSNRNAFLDTIDSSHIQYKQKDYNSNKIGYLGKNNNSLHTSHSINATQAHHQSYHDIREPLSNIDINKRPINQSPIRSHKKNKVFDMQPNIVTMDPLPISIDTKQPVIKNTSPVAKKRVAIIEPEKRSNKNYIYVNDIKYEKITLLGRGGSSKVYQVKGPKNVYYALKMVVFDEFDESSIESFKGEIELLKKLEHEYRVVKLFDYRMEDGTLYLVMECGDLDLSKILYERSKQPLDIEFIRYYAREMLKCVKVVHDNGIVHSDLKPANFVLVKSILKIIDFGIADAVPDHTVNIYRESQIGTPNYMAPEALVAMKYTDQEGAKSNPINMWKVGKPSDVWSCGCILYQMFYGKPPYGNYQGQERLMAIMNPDIQISYPAKNSNNESIPPTAIDTMKACLRRKPENRITIDELLQNSFFSPLMVSPYFIQDLIGNSVLFGVEHTTYPKEEVDRYIHNILEGLMDFHI